MLISDEVVTFRIAPGGPQEVYEYDADLTVLGKVIGGGLPVGAIAGRRDVMAVFDGSRGRAAVPNAGTFNANPLTMAAGIAALSDLTPAAIARINELADRLRTGAEALFSDLDAAAHATGVGSLFGIHMTATRFSDYRQYRAALVDDPAARLRQRALYDGLRERGVLLSIGGVGATSTAMEPADIERFLGALADTVREMQRTGMWD